MDLSISDVFKELNWLFTHIFQKLCQLTFAV